MHFFGRRRVAISDAVEGQYVTISGFVELVDPITSPVSQTPCAAYTLRVNEEDQRSDEPSSRCVHSEQQSCDFVLVDLDGNRAYVDGWSLKLYFTKIPRGATIGFAAQELLNQRGIPAPKSGRVHKVQERLLVAHDSITIRGLATWEPDPNNAPELGGYRGAKPKERLRIMASRRGAVIVRTESK